MFAGLGRVFCRDFVVALRGVRVVGRLFVIASLVMLGRLFVMGGSVGVVLGGFVVVFGGLFAHGFWGLWSSRGGRAGVIARDAATRG